MSSQKILILAFFSKQDLPALDGRIDAFDPPLFSATAWTLTLLTC